MKENPNFKMEVLLELKLFAGNTPLRFLTDTDIEEFLHIYRYKPNSIQFAYLENLYTQEMQLPRNIFSILKSKI